MDDTPDRGYSRAPELEDLVRLCRSLNEAGARYVLIGGFAVILHGSVRGTKDIDLLIDPSPANVQAIKRAMALLPDNAISLIADDEVDKYQVVRIADEIVVDLMAKACGIDYAQALREGVETMSVEDVRIPVATKALLIKTKTTYRDSDRSDIAYLRIRIEEEAKLR